MAKFKITIQQIIKEEHSMILEADSAMDALDTARRQAAARNAKGGSGKFSVTKVEQLEDSSK